MTIETAAIEQTAKDLMQLESEFRRFADEQDDLQGIPVFFLTREIGDLLTYATESNETPLPAGWLESRKATIRGAFDVALRAVSSHRTLSNQLHTAQSLSLQLARQVSEVVKSPGEKLIGFSRRRPPQSWRPILARLEGVTAMSHSTFIRRTTEGKPQFKYHRSPDSTARSVALLLTDLGIAYDDDQI